MPFDIVRSDVELVSNVIHKLVELVPVWYDGGLRTSPCSDPATDGTSVKVYCIQINTVLVVPMVVATTYLDFQRRSIVA